MNMLFQCISLHEFINSLLCKHGLIVLDCCFTVALKWEISTRKLDLMSKRIYKERYSKYTEDRAWQVITSAAYDQKALDYIGDYKIGHFFNRLVRR